MAVTITPVKQRARSVLYAITFTADGDADISLPDAEIRNISFESEGSDGGGTLTILGALNTAFTALGFNTAADPRNVTSVASITAAGMWILSRDLLGLRTLRFHLTGSTTPTLVIHVLIAF